MKVRITRCPDEKYWYAGLIGEVYSVEEFDSSAYRRVDFGFTHYIINHENCEIVSELDLIIINIRKEIK